MRRAFERSLKQIVKPALVECGFTPQKTREFVLNGHGRIEFQLGVRFMAGKFTVNVIVGNESHRIGQLRNAMDTVAASNLRIETYAAQGPAHAEGQVVAAHRRSRQDGPHYERGPGPPDA